MKNFFIIVLILLLPCAALHAQELVSAAGGNGTARGVAVSWSIGETVSGTIAGTSAALTQGVHQPRLMVISGLPELPACNVAVYPNPAEDHISVRLSGNVRFPVTVQIISVSGTLFGHHLMTSGELDITVAGLPPGLYVIWLTDQAKQTQTFKLIKK